jgi:hypothetical protein
LCRILYHPGGSQWHEIDKDSKSSWPWTFRVDVSRLFCRDILFGKEPHYVQWVWRNELRLVSSDQMMPTVSFSYSRIGNVYPQTDIVSHWSRDSINVEPTWGSDNEN